MKKQIGIPGWKTGDNSFGVGVSYIRFISKFGDPVIITPDQYDDIPDVDLLILPGGRDILPSTYGAIPSFDTDPPNIYLEHFDKTMLPQYLERETPIFSICRGSQRLWTHFGGNLIQHNNWHEQSKYPTHQCHELEFTKEFSYFEKMIGKVNSRHHQTMDASIYVPDELEVIAYSREEGHDKKMFTSTSIVEMFKHRTLPIFGVQFHPEDHFYGDDLCPSIINSLLDD